MMQRRRNAQIDTGMRLREMAQTVHEPLRREVGRRAHCQNTGILALEQPLSANGDAVECIAYDREIVAAGLGDDQALPFAVEQLDAETFFKSLDLLANRALRHTKLFSRTRKALVAGGSLERFQIVQW